MTHVEYTILDRLVCEECTLPTDTFPPGAVLLPQSPIDISSLLLASAGITDDDSSLEEDDALLSEFEDCRAERIAWFGFWSDAVTMYRYRLHNDRFLICWRGSNDGLQGIALLQTLDVYPAFFEELVASCGDLVSISGWGSLPDELAVDVNAQTLLRATFRFLTYADNGEAWDYYARLSRAGEMPITFPVSVPVWVRPQDVPYWDEAYQFVDQMLGIPVVDSL